MKTKIAVAVGMALFLLVALSMILGNDDARTDGFEYQPPPPEIVIALESGGQSEHVSEYIRNEAYNVAQQLFGDNKAKCNKFQEELLAIYSQVKDLDFVLIFNSGGWGNTPLNGVDDEWDTVVYGVGAWLKNAGYTCALMEHKRCGNSVPDILRELKAFAIARYPEADDLAARIQFFTRVQPDLRVIMLGTSSGAMYSTDVMKLLKSNPRVFSIQAGQPFWDKDPQMPRTLLMNYNGKGPDSLASGDLWAMFRHNFFRLSTVFRPGTFVKVDDTLRAPGHEYSWRYPIVREQVTEFLESNFGPKAS